MVVPFLPLQLANIGLNDKEISYVLGIMPFLLILTMPVSGKINQVNHLHLHINSMRLMRCTLFIF